MGMSADQFAVARMFLSDPGSDAIQSILIANAVGGTWTASFDGQTTSALAFDAGANVLQNALAALSNIGLGNVKVNNTAPYSVYLEGDLAHVAQPMLTVDTSNLIGTNVSATVAQIARGGVLAFSDTELNLFYDNLGQGDLYLTVSLAFEALLGDLSRLHDYVAGQSQEKLSQVPAQVEGRAKRFQERYIGQHQVQLSHMEAVPPRLEAVPVSPGVPATSLRYGPNGFPPYLRRGGW